MANMSFLIGLRPNFETAKTKVLLESEISSLQEVFSRVLCMENTPSIQSSSASAMVARGREFSYEHANTVVTRFEKISLL